MLKVALPNKGQLFQPTISLVASCGYSVKKPTKALYYSDRDNEVEFYFLRPYDIPMYLSQGMIDVGVTGIDFNVERGGVATKIIDLPFGQSKLCLAAEAASRLSNLEDGRTKTIATAFPRIVKQYFNDENLNLVTLEGAVEISISLGLAECIVDIVDTGATLKAAGLRIVGEPLFQSNAAVFVAPGSIDHKSTEQFVRRLRARIIGMEYQLIEYDIPAALIEQACALTPGLESPTVSRLKNNDWCAVKSMVRKTAAQRVADQVYELGGKAILLTNIESAML